MPWFKVDDTFAHHAKVMAAGNAALGLWVRAGAWSMQQLTDGYIPAYVARDLGSAREVQALVAVGLWLKVSDGYAFHEWSQRQPSREQVEADRHAARERQKRAREAAASRRDTRRDAQASNAVSHGPPDPTRPDPVPPTEVHTPSQTAMKAPVRSADADHEFEDWWTHYPRKVGKGQARKAYLTAAKKVGPEPLLAGVIAQAPHLANQGAYCPHPSTWLSGERWDDDPPPRPSLGRRQAETDELFVRAAKRMGVTS